MKYGSIRTGLSLFLLLSLMATSLSLLVTPARASAQDANDTAAAYAPADSLLYADFNLDQKSDQWTLASELTARSGLPDLFAPDDKASANLGLEILNSTVDGDAALVLSKFPAGDNVTLNSVTGSAAGVATDPGALAQGDIPQGWAAIFRPSDPQALHDVIQSTIEVSSSSNPAPERVDYKGYTIEVAAPADEYSTGTALAVVDDVVVLATVPDDVQAMIDVAAGDTDPLADDPHFTDIRGKLQADVLSFGYVNGPALLSAAEEADPESLSQAPDQLLTSLGAYSAYAFWADDPGFRLDTLAIPGDGTSLSAGNVLDPTFAENISADSIVYAGGTNLGDYAGLEYVALIFAQSLVGIEAGATPVASQSPEDYATDVFAQAEGVLGFNIKTDFLDQMVGEWGYGLTVQNLTMDSADVSTVFVSETGDPTAVQDVTDKITAIVGSQADGTFEISSRDVAGSSITVIDVSSSGFPLVLEYGVVNDQFMIGINGGIDDFVNGPEAPLSESDNFTATMEELPDTYTAVSYVNLEQALPLIDTAIAGASGPSVVDADPLCGDYSTQEDAQAAFDEDNFANFALDQDYDGTACEDFFTVATPEASPAAASSLSLLSIGSVFFQDGDSTGTSTIVLIGK